MIIVLGSGRPVTRPGRVGFALRGFRLGGLCVAFGGSDMQRAETEQSLGLGDPFGPGRELSAVFVQEQDSSFLASPSPPTFSFRVLVMTQLEEPLIGG